VIIFSKNIPKEVIRMYKHLYVRAKIGGFVTASNYKELIDKYSQEGWRFVTAIPAVLGIYGKIKEVDLVFEKQE
jgi:hypothetical protein